MNRQNQCEYARIFPIQRYTFFIFRSDTLDKLPSIDLQFYSTVAKIISYTNFPEARISGGFGKTGSICLRRNFTVNLFITLYDRPIQFYTFYRNIPKAFLRSEEHPLKFKPYLIPVPTTYINKRKKLSIRNTKLNIFKLIFQISIQY